eukprot:2885270-Prorocentrum_lima.AAC.1
MSIFNTAWTCPRSVFNKGKTAICGMPAMRRISMQSVASTCCTWPITRSFPLTFVERGKCGIDRPRLS